MKKIDIKNVLSYSWGDDCTSFVLIENDDLSIKEELMPPNSKEQLHFHKTAQQFFYILSGKASFQINKQIVELKKHQGIHVLPEQKHYIANKENTDLRFLVISTPSTKNDRFFPNY